MSYQVWSVVFGEQPSASKWNILGSNDASFADGTGIGNGVIINRHIGAAEIDLDQLDVGDIIANQQAWQTMTPVTGSVTTTLGYYKDSLGIVRLRGQLNMTGTGTFFTLPAGYRPEQYKEFGTSSAGGFGVLSISTAGVCQKVVGSNGNLDLDVVYFRAA